MNESQIWEACGLILKTFPLIKIPAIKLCFDRAKIGRYGKSYDRIDVQIICDWISEYIMEETEEIAMEQDRLSGERKQENKNTLIALTGLKSKDVPGYVSKEQKNDMQNFFNRKYAHWESLVDKTKFRDETGFRFIKRYGKKMNGSDYVDYKLNQQKRVIKYLNEKL